MICQACRSTLRSSARANLRSVALGLSSRSRFAAPSSVAFPSTQSTRLLSTSTRLSFAASSVSEASSSMSPAETSIADLLRSKLEGPVTHVLVQDISGGCGSMYAIEVTAEDFRGKTMLKQQRMVNAALGEVIKGWHGVQIRTAVPDA